MTVKRHRGIALILTLWILVALLMLVGAFAVMVRTEVQVARNFGDVTQCRWAARAGIRCGEAELTQLAQHPMTYLGEDGMVISSSAMNLLLGEGEYEVTIEDEAGKVNINTASVDVLSAIFGDSEIADAVIDWRDEDSTPGASGAEDAYYASLSTPYQCKDAPFDTVRELLLVKGVTQDLLSEPLTDGGPSRERLLTVYSVDDNTAMDGSARVNIQQAGSEELKSALGDILTDQDIEALVRFRQSEPLRSAADIARVQGMTRDKLQQVYPRVTISQEETLPGLMNINTTPVEVLAALPGFSPAMADAVVQHRQDKGPFEDVGQLLAVSAISIDTFIQSADMCTVRSRVFNLRSVGRLPQGTTRTITCVLDVQDPSAAIVKYWRE